MSESSGCLCSNQLMSLARLTCGYGIGAKTAGSLTPRTTSRQAALIVQTAGGVSAQYPASAAEFIAHISTGRRLQHLFNNYPELTCGSKTCGAGGQYTRGHDRAWSRTKNDAYEYPTAQQDQCASCPNASRSMINRCWCLLLLSADPALSSCPCRAISFCETS